MPSADYDHEARLRQSRETVQRAADQLHETLVELATKLEPFPYFLGSIEVRAIEAEPGGANKADRGCIVVCQDGEMYEFCMKIEAPNDFDLGMDRDDSVKPVELSPEDYVAYAYHAVQEIAGLIAEQQARAKKYSF